MAKKKDKFRLRLLSDVSPNCVVKINWNQQFNPSYVRHVLSISKDMKDSGSIIKSNYLPKSLAYKDYYYREGELFIICELREDIKKDNNLIPSLYSLVQVNRHSELGYRVYATFRESETHSCPEKKLVRTILQAPQLLASVLQE